MRERRSGSTATQQQLFGHALRGLLAAVSSAVMLSACDLGDIKTPIEDATTKTENILNDAINALSAQSADWQKILQEAQAKLTADAQSTVRNEIATVASRSISQVGVELRCNADFIGDEVRQELVRILAAFRGEKPAPVPPAFCQVVPIAVDRDAVPASVKQLEFYGYNFDHATDLRVMMMRQGLSPLDVTNQLDFPTHYAITLKFGAGGVQLDSRSERFVLQFGGRQVSSVGIIQPQTPVCQSKFVSSPPNLKVTYLPPKVRGDREFKGHGPSVTTIVTLRAEPGEVIANVFMNAREGTGDQTEARGSEDFHLFPIEPGFRIQRIVTPGDPRQVHSYTDSDHAVDTFNLGGGGVIQRLDYVGDTEGDEAGTRTQVTVTFNRITVEAVQVTGCVAASTIRILPGQGAISPRTLQKLSPAMTHELNREQLHRQ